MIVNNQNLLIIVIRLDRLRIHILSPNNWDFPFWGLVWNPIAVLRIVSASFKLIIWHKFVNVHDIANRVWVNLICNFRLPSKLEWTLLYRHQISFLEYMWPGKFKWKCKGRSFSNLWLKVYSSLKLLDNLLGNTQS